MIVSSSDRQTGHQLELHLHTGSKEEQMLFASTGSRRLLRRLPRYPQRTIRLSHLLGLLYTRFEKVYTQVGPSGSFRWSKGSRRLSWIVGLTVANGGV